ncbi:MAG: hypothetical protein BA863_13520 [Desulfovibrio sp. S3730MH75]|nr:MAG: hypothetical protein BA863_13520 [Desulfovibrio sp. S3730MH75]
MNGEIVETYLWQDLTTLLVVADEKGNNAKIFRYDEEGDPVGMTYQDKEYHFATDQVGTIFMVADDQGRELKRVIYDSFGNLLVDTNKKLDTCVGFAAGLTDKDTDLVHFGYREYDPRIGRFITPDPIGYAGGDVDVYGYCLDDPINFIDRTGLNPLVRIAPYIPALGKVAKDILDPRIPTVKGTIFEKVSDFIANQDLDENIKVIQEGRFGPKKTLPSRTDVNKRKNDTKDAKDAKK